MRPQCLRVGLVPIFPTPVGPAQLRLTQQHIPGGEGLSQTPEGLSTPGAFPSLDPFAFSCGDTAGVAPVGLSWGSSAGFIPLSRVLWGLC